MTDRVYVGYLHPGEVHTHFHHSLLSMVLWDKANSNRLGGYFAEEAAAGGIGFGRNKIVNSFLETDGVWLFMVDADMGFEPDTVDRLLASADKAERPIVGGLAFGQFSIPGSKGPLGDLQYRQVVTIMFMGTSDTGGPKVSPAEDYPRNRLVECDATGAACLLIHRSVLEAMAEKFEPPMQWFDTMNLDGRHFSEDITFCMRAKALGFPIHVDPRVKTSHRKTHFLTEDTFDVGCPPAADEVAVIVPVMERPQNAEPFMRSLRATTGLAQVHAVASDDETAKAWGDAGADVLQTADVSFASKVNYAAARLVDRFPWVFIVGDDVRFHPGWLDHAQHTAAIRQADVVGTNDLGNPRVVAGDHATHMLIRSSYIAEQGASWDGPGVVCHEGYRHCFVDDEIVAVAKQRGVWAMAYSSKVEHIHPAWGKAEMDDVYQIGRDAMTGDKQTFRKRYRKHVDPSVSGWRSSGR